VDIANCKHLDRRIAKKGVHMPAGLNSDSDEAKGNLFARRSASSGKKQIWKSDG